MARNKQDFPWRDKVINAHQIAGIETSVVDNGPGRGNRIAWINTGSGLRYKVLIDRAMDIAEAFFNAHSLAWLSHGGTPAPESASDRGLDWLYGFGGGLMTTCGLSHMGGPESDEYGERGLHGRISNVRGEIESIVQPDPMAGKLEMSITGVMKESRVFGPNLELRRTIAGTVGEATIRIRDVVTNRGNVRVPHMMLYHCNFGWPLVDEGTQIVWKGKCISRGLDMDKEIFNDKHDYRKCQPPLESHRGSGEVCAFLDVNSDREGMCTVGLYNAKLKLALSMRFKKKQLPWVTNWQHWGFGDYVCALEPGSNPPIGQKAAREQGTLMQLGPGRSKTYELELSVLTEEKAIGKFLRNGGGA